MRAYALHLCAAQPSGTGTSLPTMTQSGQHPRILCGAVSELPLRHAERQLLYQKWMGEHGDSKGRGLTPRV